MDIKNKNYIPTREPVEAVKADPKIGLNADQVSLRKACGWSNIAPASVSKS